MLTSISYTSHPVGWEEVSARSQDVINKAEAMLQESYNYTHTTRGADMTEFVLSAPVLLAGEDVPFKSLLGKVVRSTLTNRKGDLMPHDLPVFPVRQWLEYLTTLDRGDVLEKYEALKDYCIERCVASKDDDGAMRMAGNYAAVLLAWRYLCDFAGIDTSQGGFGRDLIAEMNAHMGESKADRSPWVWIMETIFSEIDAGHFKHPTKLDVVDGERCILIRTAHIMDHLAHTPYLREKYNRSPVKSPAVFKRQIAQAGVVVGDKDVERMIWTRRVAHLTPISLDRLERDYHLSVALREDEPKERS